MTVTTIQQIVEVTEVGMTTSSDIVEDTENNVYVREIRAYSEPDGNGTRTLIFTLRLSAGTESYVQLSAPVQTF